MTSSVDSRARDLFADYQTQVAPSDAPDELLRALETGRGTSSAANALLAEFFEHGHDGLGKAFRRARRFVADEGVVYGVGGNRGPWRIDPIPVVIGGAEWETIERGLAQRHELLRLILLDLYGDQTLLRDRLLPAQVIFGHSGFVRSAVGLPPEQLSLRLTATDLGRGTAGQWQVLSDRTQAPSGAGYAMATRRIMSQVLPHLNRTQPVAKLRTFFHTAASAILAAAPETEDHGRTVLLSPGTGSETAFDQAFFASLLGVPLVESDDLVVQGGKPWLRASHGLVPVDTIVRRVDETWMDPLELRGDSQLGVPGLLEAVREGHVAVHNAIGAGVLENAALHSFLPKLSRHLLGEELALESAPSWWCGNPHDQQYVMEHLDELMIRPIARSEGMQSIPGWQLSATERDGVRQQIQAQPWAWAAQATLPLSTSPIVTPDGLEPRHFVLRTFGVDFGDDHMLMPGGLGRVGAARDEVHISSATGAIAKDVWVLAERIEPRMPTPRGRLRRAPGHGVGFEITPRGADNLFWFGRYTERTDATVRLLGIASELANDHAGFPGTPGVTALGALLATLHRITGVRARHGDEPALDYLREQVTTAASPGTISASVRRLGNAAQEVREMLSDDTWAVISDLDRAVEAVPPRTEALRTHFDELLEPLLALQGMVAHGMYRDASWAFLDSGIRLERAQFTTSLLRAAFATALPPIAEYLLAEAVLGVGDATITQRRFVASGAGPDGQVDSTIYLMLMDVDNPRSAAFQLDRIRKNLRTIGDEQLAGRVETVLARLQAIDVEQLIDDRELLDLTLGELLEGMRQLSAAFNTRHFRRQAPHASQPERWSTPDPRAPRSAKPEDA